MSFRDVFDQDLARILETPLGFATDVLFHPKGENTAIPLRGIFGSTEEASTQAGGTAPVPVCRMELLVQESDLPRDPMRGDTFTVRGTRYDVIRPAANDGEGLLTISLGQRPPSSLGATPGRPQP